MLPPPSTSTYVTNMVLLFYWLKLEHIEQVPGLLQPYGEFTEIIDERTSTVYNSLVEDCTFKWQQKLQLKRNEIFQPRDQNFPQQKHTNQEESTTNTEESRSRIFTLIDGEEPDVSNKKENINNDVPTGENKFAERIAASRNRRIEPITMSQRNQVIDLPQRGHQIKARSIERTMKTMYIMAYLGPFLDSMDEYDKSNEYVVCKITSINGTNIILEPDLFFSYSVIESRYGIYKARMYLVKNEVIQTDEIDSDQWFGEEESTTLSDLPPDGTTKLIYLIDIESAENFSHNSLHIEYKFDLPAHCKLDGLSPVLRCSSMTDSTSQKQDDVAVLSQPVCATLIIKDGKQLSSDFYWPRMTFRISSEDYWGCFFVDGYGFLTLPSQPGRHQFDVRCWKFSHKKDRKSLLYEQYVAQTSDFGKTGLNLATEVALSEVGRIASRIGLTTISSGTLKINVQCIMQSRKLISHGILLDMKHRTVMRCVGMHSQIHWKILKVLSAFEEARRNFIRIRNQPLPAFPRKS